MYLQDKSWFVEGSQNSDGEKMGGAEYVPYEQSILLGNVHFLLAEWKVASGANVSLQLLNFDFCISTSLHTARLHGFTMALQNMIVLDPGAQLGTFVYVFVLREFSLVARYARGKPHPRLEAFGADAGFSTTHGQTRDLPSVSVQISHLLVSTCIHPWKPGKTRVGAVARTPDIRVRRPVWLNHQAR